LLDELPPVAVKKVLNDEVPPDAALLEELA
jgi:hypothetical protein